jgi:hypothetical protein
MGLSFSTPDGWRLLAESGAEELVLAPGKSKTTPVLRVRAFQGRLSAKDRLAEMTRSLGKEEALVAYQESESWTLDGRTFETVTAGYKKGSQEWYARFTLVDQPKKLQHGFWLFGREQDIKRQWSAVQASIRSAAGAQAAPPAAGADGGSTQESGAAVWQDVKSGLHVAQWPLGFRPQDESLTRLSSTGLVLVPSDATAPSGIELRLSRRSVGELVSPTSTADTLEQRLGETAGVSSPKRLNVRVDGQPGVSLRWAREVDGASWSYEVWLWKRGSALYRLDAAGPASWMGARKRRDLVKDFVAGLSTP